MLPNIARGTIAKLRQAIKTEICKEFVYHIIPQLIRKVCNGLQQILKNMVTFLAQDFLYSKHLLEIYILHNFLYCIWSKVEPAMLTKLLFIIISGSVSFHK
jgi:hypothetical protein